MAVADFRNIPGISRRERVISDTPVLQEQLVVPDLIHAIPQPSEAALQASKQARGWAVHLLDRSPLTAAAAHFVAVALQAGLTRDVNCLKDTDRRKRLAAVSMLLSALLLMQCLPAS